MAKVGIISLGCSRNLVDSEVMLGSLKKNGFKIADAREAMDICIINTCAFIKEAREESIEVILEACRLKKRGKIKRLVIAGCLSQLYKEGLAKEIPEVDLVVGTSDFLDMGGLIKGLRRGVRRSVISRKLTYLYDESSERLLSTPRHYAYVKVAEGCSNFCTYCIISRLRGEFRSRTIESVVEEVRRLSRSSALKEINLIGQDTTLFGIDRYGKIIFPELLRRLCRLKNSVRWIRVLYTHPAHYTNELIKTIRDERKICRYLDLPIQHISDRILKQMNRRTTKKDIVKLIGKLRKDIPGIMLRTSIIVGFPGETDKDFKELLNFVREMRFERLGAFIYSKEEGTSAAGLSGQVPETLKKERLNTLMELQKEISADINKSFLGKRLEVLIDEPLKGETDKFLGRTEGDAPEVDGVVHVSGRHLKVGEFYKVKITDAFEYDLVGEA